MPRGNGPSVVSRLVDGPIAGALPLLADFPVLADLLREISRVSTREAELERELQGLRDIVRQLAACRKYTGSSHYSRLEAAQRQAEAFLERPAEAQTATVLVEVTLDDRPAEEAARAAKSASDRRRYEEKIAAARCTKCREPAEVGRTQCARHLGRKRESAPAPRATAHGRHS